jgi:hypothetical protein
MTKKRRVYISRVVGDQVMTSADLERLHKELLEYERIDFISDEMRGGRRTRRHVQAPI